MRERPSPVRFLCAVAAALVLCLASAGVSAPPAGAVDLRPRLAKLNDQFRGLIVSVRGCPEAQPLRRRAAPLRQRAVRFAAFAHASTLATRRKRLARSVQLLRAAARRCTRPAIPPGLPPLAPLPGVGGGVGRGGPVVVPIRLADVVDGRVIDLSQHLGEFQLPARLAPLTMEALDDRSCRGVAAVCLGLDRAALDRELRDLVNRNLVELALRNLSALNLRGLLTQIDTLVAGGMLGGLISVQRVGDRQVKLVSSGALGELSGLPGVPDVVVGRIQLVGVIRCPPAEVGGLPRVCVA
jgi:hypothetical protein